MLISSRAQICIISVGRQHGGIAGRIGLLAAHSPQEASPLGGMVCSEHGVGVRMR